MEIDNLTGPIVHVCIPLAIAYVFRLNIAVTVFCALLPDLIDKPLSAQLGIIGGRYIAHTLLFVAATAFAFSIWKRSYGLSAIVGGVSHLLLDWTGPLPLLYPFLHYDFQRGTSSPFEYLGKYSNFYFTARELAVGIGALLIAILISKLRRIYCEPQKCNLRVVGSIIGFMKRAQSKLRLLKGRASIVIAKVKRKRSVSS